jgi:hypothetical protein
MRCVNWRALALAAVMAAGAATTAQADQWPWHHTIPRETLALDYRTGDVMMAPPIPYGEYTKDYAGAVHGAVGTAAGFVHGLPGHLAGLCGKCGNALCGGCGGLGHHKGSACGSCGGDGCGTCGRGLFGHGRGLFGHGGGGHGLGHGRGLGLLGGHGGKHGGHGHAGGGLCGPGMPCASAQSAPVVATAQSVRPSGQSVACGSCHGLGRLGNGGLCGGCGGKGLLGKLCGLCGGLGRLHGGDPCGGCGGKGLCGNDHNACSSCGGKGCGHCGGTGKIHALASHVLGTARGLLHHGDGGVEYFVGPGGPVPLTPGYVPYVVPVRSPRDYFAFPPFTDQSMP